MPVSSYQGQGGWPTLYPGVNAILDELLSRAQVVLDGDFSGMYLYGSLALGDFNLDKSDIDFIIVTEGQLPEKKISALALMHSQIAAGDSKWARQLEGSYIPRLALRRYDPEQASFPNIAHDGSLKVDQHGSDWIIQRYILREHGVILAGPDPQTLIDPVGPDDLRQAIRDLLQWWGQQLTDTSLIRQSLYQAFAVLSMCRVHYTMRQGDIVTKPAAAHWAMEALDQHWLPLIQSALAWQPPESLNRLQETMAFIRFTLDEYLS